MKTDIKKSTHPGQEEVLNLNIYNPSIAKHSVRFNSYGLRVKPPKKDPKSRSIIDGIHKDLKSGENAEFTLREILEKVTHGYCVKPGAFRMPGLTEDERAELNELYKEDFSAYTDRKAEIERKKQLKLISTDLMVLDVDDRTGATDMQAVFEYSGAVALYCSFSHGKTSEVFHTRQNSYKLIFALDEAVTDDALLRYIQDAKRVDLYARFPALLPVEGVKGSGNNGIDVVGTGFFFGTTIPQHLINDRAELIQVGPFAEKHALEKELQAYAASLKKDRGALSAIDEEILAMAEFLGVVDLSFEQWTTLAIGLFNSAQAGTIDEGTALDVLGILDGNKEAESFYLGYKRPTSDSKATATVGTFIKLATDRGFKREATAKYAAMAGCKEPDIETEIIKQKETHVPATVITDILNGDKRAVLLVSDTNSGKTYATIEGCKAYLKENPEAFVYYAGPTKALGGQVSSKYGLGRALQDDEQAALFVRRALDDGSRILAGTYDKASKVLKALPQPYKLVVVVDEAHKEVTDYNFRHAAIKQLFGITESERVIKFLALTGTPQEINLAHYDQRCIIEREGQPDIAEELLFIEYNKAGDYTAVVTQTIAKTVNRGSKVVAFVNSRKQIELIRKALEKLGIRAVALSADNRKSATYSSIVTSENIPENVQVVLATIVIADGINIQNGADYVCIIAPTEYGKKKAPFFSVPLIKQASNRFRNTYKRLIIPIFIKSDLEDERKADQPYPFEGRYQWLLRDANRIRAVLAENYADCLGLYSPSVVEAIYGLFNTGLAARFNFKAADKEEEKKRLGKPYNVSVVEQLDRIRERLLTVDERAIRYQASRDQERYYVNHPNAFKRAIVDITAIKQVRHTLIADYLADEAEDEKTAILDELKRLEQQAELEDQEKRERVAEILTATVFDRLQAGYLADGKVNENTDLWRATKKALHPDHASALKELVRFLDYGQTIKEVTRIDNRKKTSELLDHLKYWADLEAFSKAEAEGKRNATQTIIAHIKQVFDSKGRVPAKEREELLDAIAKKYRISNAKKSVEVTFKKFFVQSKPKSARIDGKVVEVRSYKLLDPAYIAEYHGFTTDEIQGMYERLKYNRKLKG